MEPQKITKKEETKAHKLISAMRFLKHLHEEIELAKNLGDIQDKVILDKFQEVIAILEKEILS